MTTKQLFDKLDAIKWCNTCTWRVSFDYWQGGTCYCIFTETHNEMMVDRIEEANDFVSDKAKYNYEGIDYGYTFKQALFFLYDDAVANFKKGNYLYKL